MSTLAKVFVVIIFALSAVFFGTSATLFLTREDYGARYAQLRENSMQQINELGKKVDEQTDRQTSILNALNILRESERELSARVKKAEEALAVEQARASRAESERTAHAHAAAEARQLATAMQEANTDLLGKLQAANDERERAISLQQRAIEDRNRMKRDLDASSQELHVARVEYKELVDRYETQELLLNAYIVDYGHRAPGLAPTIDALVSAVDGAEDLVLLSVGSDQKVQEGYEFTIYRDASFIGKVKVTKVYPSLSGAEVVFTDNGARIRRGDRATTRP
jgi:hypothetical protein